MEIYVSTDASRPLAGRCALVTGSTEGIGRETADALAAMGADVVINGFGEAAAISRQCASLSERHGVRVIHNGADVAKPDEVRALVKAAEAHGGGKLDVLINNAGYAVDSPVESFEPEIWDHQIALNLSGPFHAIRAALPGMRARNWGRIVNVASTMGLVGFKNRAGYVATKHGLVGLTKVVALETADTPITCNAVCPGIVDVDRVVSMHKKKAQETGVPFETLLRELMTFRQPSGNYIASKDIAAAIAFLCGPHASEIRGIAMPLEGGWTAR